MELFVPGRICLFGEHSDWAGGFRRSNAAIEKGYTLICGTDQGLYAEVAPHPNALVLTASTPDGQMAGPEVLPLDPVVLLEVARAGGFWSYVAGVAYQAVTHHQVEGLVVHNHRTDLPVKKGLSSSAAICVLVARAFNRLYDLRLTTRGEMELAYQGEVTTPSRCGRMDQGCAFGRCPVLMTFDGDQVGTEPVEPGGPVHLVVADLQARKDTLVILSRLNACYSVRDNGVADGVQKLLGPVNRDVVARAAEALRAGDARTLGELMTEAQALFDRYALPACPEELTAPVLHRVLNYQPLLPHVWGGKGVGSQGDGTAQFVARSAADQEAVVRILGGELGLPCLKVTLGTEEAAAQEIRIRSKPAPIALPATAQPVRKAVIPAAGLGTRLFPATRAVRKEFFPVVDAAGCAKPALQMIVEEALSAGVEEVVIVVQPDAEEEFRRFFHEPMPRRLAERLSPWLQAQAAHVMEVGAHVSFVIQHEQAGFGHAVSVTRDAVGDEPFLLLLGDHLYHSDSERPAAAQMLDCYRMHGRALLGLRRVAEAAVVHYGVVAGPWIEAGRLLEVKAVVEKPPASRARATLRVPGLAEGEYLALFGQYLLPPAVFEHLDRLAAAGARQHGEMGLTPALVSLQQEQGMLGLLVEGEAFDIGLPGSYVEVLQRFARDGREVGSRELVG
ncbi:MAG TPA: sugar phosphate nucleotidyltransferase [Anaerolineae bacterium]|nr:sugar phosphate nucleotidyltransferase [Anaerolineae bacterium]